MTSNGRVHGIIYIYGTYMLEKDHKEKPEATQVPESVLVLIYGKWYTSSNIGQLEVTMKTNPTVSDRERKQEKQRKGPR